MSSDDTHTEDVYAEMISIPKPRTKQTILFTEKPEKMDWKQDETGVTYLIGEFKCPACGESHTLHCNRKGRKKRHWVE